MTPGLVIGIILAAGAVVTLILKKILDATRNKKDNTLFDEICENGFYGFLWLLYLPVVIKGFLELRAQKISQPDAIERDIETINAQKPQKRTGCFLSDDFYKFCVQHSCREDCKNQSDYCPIADEVRNKYGAINGAVNCEGVFMQRKEQGNNEQQTVQSSQNI